MTEPKNWAPEGFDSWQSLYPSTPFSRPPAHLDWTDRFIERWHTPRLNLAQGTLVVLVAGLYSEFLPQCFKACAALLRAQGHDVLRMPVRSSRGSVDQGAHIVKVLGAQLKQGQRFVVLAHSKGGIDALSALSQDEGLREACDGVALVQPPRGPSTVVNAVLDGSASSPARRLGDTVLKAIVRLPWMTAGTRDISRYRDARVAAILATMPTALHCVHVVSWSAIPRSRLDTYHRRLEATRPGCAHDGQFYMEDLSLQGVPQICLPHLDHGQPILGGAGFVPSRFWLTLLDVLHHSRPAV